MRVSSHTCPWRNASSPFLSLVTLFWYAGLPTGELRILPSSPLMPMLADGTEATVKQNRSYCVHCDSPQNRAAGLPYNCPGALDPADSLSVARGLAAPVSMAVCSAATAVSDHTSSIPCIDGKAITQRLVSDLRVCRHACQRL